MWKCEACGRTFKNAGQDHFCMKPNDIDAYIEACDEDRREALYRVRETIREAAPNALEHISWQIPTFWQGENLIHFAAFKNHLGIYPGASGIEAFKARFDAEGYKYSKGAVQFPWAKPIPYELIAEMARFRVGEAQRGK